MKLSVCTLAHGRETHLANLVRGLAASRTPPLELVIAVMQGERYDNLPHALPDPRSQVAGHGRLPTTEIIQRENVRRQVFAGGCDQLRSRVPHLLRRINQKFEPQPKKTSQFVGVGPRSLEQFDATSGVSPTRSTYRG